MNAQMKNWCTNDQRVHMAYDKDAYLTQNLRHLKHFKTSAQNHRRVAPKTTGLSGLQ